MKELLRCIKKRYEFRRQDNNNNNNNNINNNNNNLSDVTAARDADADAMATRFRTHKLMRESQTKKQGAKADQTSGNGNRGRRGDRRRWSGTRGVEMMTAGN